MRKAEWIVIALMFFLLLCYNIFLHIKCSEFDDDIIKLDKKIPEIYWDQG